MKKEKESKKFSIIPVSKSGVGGCRVMGGRPAVNAFEGEKVMRESEETCAETPLLVLGGSSSAKPSWSVRP